MHRHHPKAEERGAAALLEALSQRVGLPFFEGVGNQRQRGGPAELLDRPVNRGVVSQDPGVERSNVLYQFMKGK